MGATGGRAAIYVRVSTDGQTVANQTQALHAVAERRGWQVVHTYADAGVSGAKGRDQRPGLDAALRDATRRRYDVLLVWAIDRLGRSAAAVAATLDELHGAGVALYADKEAVDGSTPHGRAMLQMAGVFAELERSMIRERVKAGLARAKVAPRAGARAIGRPKVPAETEAAIRAHLAAGTGALKTAKALGVGVGTVMRVKRAIEVPTAPSDGEGA